ncbi:PDR/VanB family oxidoreductase [Pseudohalocynthiibacter sp. F2068]|jgi:ferredoxin-NADP reductase|uniref:PDR/VanB family oxidoreductase n=1 Tax=Pseudohalocynthiibacter sp. F2068 TaxID=2926418 RepID=UPI001FF4872D|nr:PDR/VanB family oxidoreductase [Pseudohalocynthiibacter sp. F2068]MCK0103091.1 PDR/VanB family oxidoreductase [Pseudohalocynthiibacter sp. F2068]
MDLIVREKKLIAAETVRLRLECADGRPLPEFEPGAHVELLFNGLSRRYSLTSDLSDRQGYEICVLRTDPSRGGSAFVHDELQVGSGVTLFGPFNAFKLDVDAAHSVIIAGGIGVTPFYSMIEKLTKLGKSFEVHYAARNLERLLPLTGREGSISLYTDDGAKPALNLENVLRKTPKESAVYVCGPRPLIEATIEKAGELGWAFENIHFESFGATQKPDDAPVTVKLAQTGMKFTVVPGTTILEALEENGIWASYECRRGECGSCATAFVSGTPDHRDVCLTPEQRGKVMCPCVSWVKGSEITLDI